jgi:hypothetical protein
MCFSRSQHDVPWNGRITSWNTTISSVVIADLTRLFEMEWRQISSLFQNLGSTSLKPEDESSHLQHRCIEQHCTVPTLFDE